MLFLACAGLLSAVSVYAVDRIERMTEGPVPADPDLLKVVFRSGLLVTCIFAYAIITGTSRSYIAMALLPFIVAATLAAAYAWKTHHLKTAAQLRTIRFDRDVRECIEALRRDPKNAAAHARLAEIYEEARDWPKAVEHGRRLCELEPSEKNRRRLAQLERQGQGNS
ncbi:MAG: hypothetical protein NTY77_15615 [Elusimicrobia bacterium]|nr:hypothetical protein [Elusimicrobiota bacterium]